MAYTKIIEIDGYEFTLNFNGYWVNGVCISNDTDVNTDGFIKALETAIKTHQSESRVSKIVEIIDSDKDISDLPSFGLHPYESYKLAEKTLKTPEYLDTSVIEILNQFLTMVEQPKFKPSIHGDATPIDGFVYIASSNDGLYKIGKSKNPTKRVERLAQQFKKDLELVTTISTDDYTRLERDIHQMFIGFHLEREWFHLTPQAVGWLSSLHKYNYWS